MIESVPASQLKPGDVFSTDGGVVTYVDRRGDSVYVESVCHGVGKSALLAAEFVCHLWRKDAPAYEHLGTWNRDLDARTSVRLDLWDTGRVGDGKSELGYALAFVPDSVDTRATIVEGEDFRPSPLHAIDSDETASALLSFIAYYGETSEPIEGLTTRQRDTLRAWHEDLALWSSDLSEAGRLDRAREAGREHGLAAASWYFDGNTSDETYRTVLAGIDEGDPAVLDTFPSSPLSGEYAGDPTPQTVFADLDMTGDEDYADDVIEAYEDGFYQASSEAIERAAREQVKS